MLWLLTFLLWSGEKEFQAELVAGQLLAPFAVAFDASGKLYFVEYQGHRLGMLNETRQPVYLAGTGSRGDRDGLPGTSAMNSPHNLAIDSEGNVYLADSFNHKIKKYSPRTGELITIAGTGKAGFSGDGGPADKAIFNETYHVTLDPQNRHLYVVDLKNQRIRRINLQSNQVSTVAGNGKKGMPVEGAKALASPFNDPRALIVDESGQLFILQRGGHDLWKVDRDGVLHRLAGNGKKGYAGDGELAVNAQLNGPKHLCFDQDHNILIADTENHCIRLLDVKTGRIHLVAGRGKGILPGLATNIQLNQPHGVTFEFKSKTIYIADSSNNRIIRLWIR